MSSAKIATTPYMPPRYLNEASELLALMTCGQKRGYHVRSAYSVHHKGSYRPVHDSLAVDSWLPARFIRARRADEPELPKTVLEPRILSAHTVANHLAGKGWVGVAPPSWTSWFAFDIDLAKGREKSEDKEEAQRRCDAMLSAIWWAFDFGTGRLPVVLRTPGGGYHVYVPLARSKDDDRNTWPAHVIRERVIARLEERGLQLRDGELELWPSGKILRLPMGRQMCLLEPQNPDDPDCLGLRPVHAKWGTRADSRSNEILPVLRRDIGAGARAFIEAFKAARKPIAEWLLDDEADWSSKYGPFGDVPPAESAKNQSLTTRVPHVSQQYEEGKNSRGDLLLKGEFFRRRISKLLRTGLTVPGGRHDAALKLTYYFGVNLNLSEAASMQALSHWLLEFDHASSFRSQHGNEKFVVQTLREARHYFRTVVSRIGVRQERRGLSLGLPLGDDAAAFSEKFSSPAVEEAAFAILRFLKGRASPEGLVSEPVELAGTLLRLLCGERRVAVEREDGSKKRVRATQLAIEELTALGVLTLYKNYRPDHYGRHFCCWFQFGSGALPSQSKEGHLLKKVLIEEGTLILRSTGESFARVKSEIEVEEDAPKVPQWVKRIYERHNFAPGDLVGDLSRHLGSFRDYSAFRKEMQPENENAEDREMGVVLSFDDAAGYGFIASDKGGADLFVHQTSICMDGFRDLRVGERVEYTRALVAKGLRALWVRRVESTREASRDSEEELQLSHTRGGERRSTSPSPLM